MINDRSIILIGPMGAGKTAVGRELARLIDWNFIDTDAEIEARTGVDVGFIFDKEGEAGFRQREAAVLADALGLDRTVVSTGGGIVLDPANRERIATAGFVVYLTATIESQLDRTGRTRKRPLLELPDPRARLIELAAARTPLYESLASLTLGTDNQTPREVARDLQKRLCRD